MGMDRALYHLNRAALRMIPILPGPELMDLVLAVRHSKSNLDQQVQEAIDALQKSTELVNKLERGVQERSEKLAKLRADYERYSSLAEVEADKARAIIGQLQQAVGARRVRERWIAFGINIVAGALVFLAGVALNEPVKAFFTAVVKWVAP